MCIPKLLCTRGVAGECHSGSSANMSLSGEVIERQLLRWHGSYCMLEDCAAPTSVGLSW